MPAAYLGIGTNVGDHAANVAHSLSHISRVGRIYETSPIYATAPVGHIEQAAFWNLVVRVSTALPPEELLLRLKEIEQRMGRVATFRNGPRLIDIDIVLYGDVVMDGAVQIPHPRFMQRAFVLRPLADIAPDLVDPRTGRRIVDALADVADQHVERVTPS